MSGRARLPGGEPRKASQRKARRAGQAATKITPVWRPGDAVRWKDRSGTFRREAGDEKHAEIDIAGRIYRVPLTELR
jgi:hypothetical protein